MTLPRLRRDGRIVEQSGTPSLQHQKDWQALVAAVEGLDTTTDALQTAIALVNAAFARRSVTATGNLTATDYLVLADATSGAITLTLPAVASANGAYIIVKKVDVSANAVTIDGNGAETIDGATTKALTAQYDAVTVACDGSQWWIV